MPVGLALIAVTAFFMFGDAWWVTAASLVFCGLVIGFLDLELTRLRAELDRYKAASAPDRATPSEKVELDSAALRRHLLSPAPPRSANERTRDS